MLSLIFKYNENKIVIQCNANDIMRDICQKFATKIDSKVDSKIYIFKNAKLNINPELNLTFEEQVNSEYLNDTNEKEIQVFDNKDDEYTISVTYRGEKKEIMAKKSESMGSLTSKISNLFKRKINSFYSIYNGKAILNDEMDKSIEQISKAIDKNEKQMNLVVEDGMEDEEGGERKSSVEIPTENNINDAENEKKEEESEFLIYRNSKEAGKFLLKIHFVLLIQFLVIGFFVWLGFRSDFEDVFIDKSKSMIWTFVIITLFTFCVTSAIMCYDGEQTSCMSFNIVIYIPIMIIYFFLLSKYTKNDYILIQLSLFISDFLAIVLFILLFGKYKGYGVLFFILILNVALILIFYYTDVLYLKEKNAIITISILSFIFIAYIIIFNDYVRQKFEDNEVKGAIFHFNYNIFVPALIIFILGLLTSILMAFCGIIIGFSLIALVLCLIVLFFMGLR